MTVPEYLSEKKREDSKKIVRKRLKLKELGRRITAEANDPRPSRDEVRIGAEAVILSRLGSRAKALAAKRLKKAKRKGLGAMVLSELVYCSHLVGFNDFQSARGVLGCLHFMAWRAIRDASNTQDGQPPQDRERGFVLGRRPNRARQK